MVFFFFWYSFFCVGVVLCRVFFFLLFFLLFICGFGLVFCFGIWGVGVRFFYWVFFALLLVVVCLDSPESLSFLSPPFCWSCFVAFFFVFLVLFFFLVFLW